ncbi:MAG: glycosyltransferase [Acidimicrobiales bacterium]
MRLLAACSLGGAGHLRPLLPFLEAARAAGHETVLVGPPALEAMAAAAGWSMLVGGEPPEAVVAPIREQLAVLAPAEAAALAAGELFGRLAATAMLPAMASVFERWRPTHVLREPCEYASAVLAQRTATPTAQVAISLAEVEAGSLSLASAALDAHQPGIAGALRGTDYLSRFPASLDPSPLPRTHRYRVDEPARAPLPDAWGGSTAPLVYVSLGTVLGRLSTAADRYRAVLEAVRRLDARVLFSVGPAFDRSLLGPVPPHVEVTGWVHEPDAAAAAAVVVCHGGSGTVYGALAAGVPVVVVPAFADQRENARRVAAAGAGLAVDPPGPGAIAAAVTAVLGDGRFRERARRLAAETAAAPTPGELLAALWPSAA